MTSSTAEMTSLDGTTSSMFNSPSTVITSTSDVTTSMIRTTTDDVTTTMVSITSDVIESTASSAEMTMSSVSSAEISSSVPNPTDITSQEMMTSPMASTASSSILPTTSSPTSAMASSTIATTPESSNAMTSSSMMTSSGAVTSSSTQYTVANSTTGKSMEMSPIAPNSTSQSAVEPLSTKVTTIDTTTTTTLSTTTTTNQNALYGGIGFLIGIVATLIVIGLIYWFCRRRNKRRQRKENGVGIGRCDSTTRDVIENPYVDSEERSVKYSSSENIKMTTFMAVTDKASSKSSSPIGTPKSNRSFHSSDLSLNLNKSTPNSPRLSLSSQTGFPAPPVIEDEPPPVPPQDMGTPSEVSEKSDPANLDKDDSPGDDTEGKMDKDTPKGGELSNASSTLDLTKSGNSDARTAL